MLGAFIVLVVGLLHSGATWRINLLLSVKSEVQLRSGVFSFNWFTTVSKLSSDYESLSKGRPVLVLVSGYNGLRDFKVVCLFIVKYSAGASFRHVLPIFLGR